MSKKPWIVLDDYAKLTQRTISQPRTINECKDSTEESCGENTKRVLDTTAHEKNKQRFPASIPCRLSSKSNAPIYLLQKITPQKFMISKDEELPTLTYENFETPHASAEKKGSQNERKTLDSFRRLH